MSQVTQILESILHGQSQATEKLLPLAEACREDSQLQEQVLSLLQADADDGDSDFLQGTPLVRTAGWVAEKPGDRIGRYKLLQQLGEGGCGVVYMAEQQEPVRRRVALKVVKLGTSCCMFPRVAARPLPISGEGTS